MIAIPFQDVGQLYSFNMAAWYARLELSLPALECNFRDITTKSG